MMMLRKKNTSAVHLRAVSAGVLQTKHIRCACQHHFADSKNTLP
jgi:hypothetical protein